MRLLVVGAGSTGGYFGGRLAEAGRDVTFLVRPRRAAQLRETGLHIRSPFGDVALTPRLVLASEIEGPYDIVLLTVKGYALQASLDDIAPAIGPRTIIIPVLNGMAHVDLLQERFGAEAVGGGLCRCSTTLNEAGEILQLNKMQDLIYGPLTEAQTARFAEIDAFFKNAGFEARLSQDIAREMWGKWFYLASLAAVTCLLRGNIGEIASTPYGADVSKGIIAEVQAIISAVGVAPAEKMVAAAVSQLTDPASQLASSMFRDLQAGLPVEVHEILGDLVRRGREAGVPAPLLSAAHSNLSVYAAGQAG